jgi:hypothetical protein
MNELSDRRQQPTAVFGRESAYARPRSVNKFPGQLLFLNFWMIDETNHLHLTQCITKSGIRKIAFVMR